MPRPKVYKPRRKSLYKSPLSNAEKIYKLLLKKRNSKSALKGMTIKQISDELNISESTVRRTIEKKFFYNDSGDFAGDFKLSHTKDYYYLEEKDPHKPTTDEVIQKKISEAHTTYIDCKVVDEKSIDSFSSHIIILSLKNYHHNAVSNSLFDIFGDYIEFILKQDQKLFIILKSSLTAQKTIAINKYIEEFYNVLS